MIKKGRTIFLGDTQEYLGVLAKRYDPEAWLLDQSNYDRLSQCANVTVYTSLGDLPKNLVAVADLLASADEIFYCPPNVWSDGLSADNTDPTASTQGLTETLLLYLCDRVDIHGLENIMSQDIEPMPLVDHRQSQDAQLWIAGCSISHGMGVADDQRYGALLARELDMPCSFLTRPGSALDWAAGQILRSDIRPKDIIVWGLTDWQRLTRVHEHRLLKGIIVKSYDLNPGLNSIVSIDNLFAQYNFYHHRSAIQQVINYAYQIGVALLLVGLLPGNYALLRFLRAQNNYIHIPYQLAYHSGTLMIEPKDLGTDSVHPGPMQHQEYFSLILDWITRNNIKGKISG